MAKTLPQKVWKLSECNNESAARDGRVSNHMPAVMPSIEAFDTAAPMKIWSRATTNTPTNAKTAAINQPAV
jgi:hypothetical protein